MTKHLHNVWSCAAAMLMLLSCYASLTVLVESTYDYSGALDLSLRYFEAQRSGRLPSNQRVQWRGDSALNDGRSEGVNLVGGYYDAGDNVKFGLPMAFTITMLSWSVLEYGSELAKQGQMQHALEAIQWGTDYFIRAHPQPNTFWAEVGDGDTDHNCWQRPEDMTTSRRAYKVDQNHPGSEVAAETAAALAAAAMVFKASDQSYSNTLLMHAKQLFDFANSYRGKYDISIPIVKQYYESFSGYDDELLWGAMWLYRATGDTTYIDFVTNNAQILGGTGWAMTQFGWDVKYAGVQVLAAKIVLEGKGGAHTNTLQGYKEKAEYFLCAALGRNNGQEIRRSPGGMFWTQSWNNLQYVSTATFLLTVYSDYLSAAQQQLQCPGQSFQSSQLLQLAQSQVNYILGNNPRGTSYMVGYGQSYVGEVHHRGASIVSIKKDATFVSCRGGYAEWFGRPEPNPNVLQGGIVGGPDENDNFVDRRDNYEGTEACTYNTSPLVGVLAKLSSNPE